MCILDYSPLYTIASIDNCPLLSSPEHGHIASTTGNAITDTVIIECFDNFVLLGSEIRRCQPNGQWSGTATKCVGKLTIVTLNFGECVMYIIEE